MRLIHKKINLLVDYQQFYLWDREMNPQAPDDYTPEDTVRRIKTGTYVVVIQPERNLTIPLEIEIHDGDPEYEPEEWDHIAEASLHLPSGSLEVHECTGGPVAEFDIQPGWYRIRSLHGGFDTITDSIEGNDYYKIVLWPAPPSDVAVIKQYPS